jgi:hypothetical protein
MDGILDLPVTVPILLLMTIRRSVNLFATATCVLVILLSRMVHAAELRVPEQYGSVQAAVNAASSGDIILIGTGTFTGAVNISAKALTLRGNGLSGTILSAGGSGRVLNITNVPSPGVQLEHLAVRDGRIADHGAGMRVSGAVVRARDCRFTANVSHRDVGCAWCGSEIYGGGIYSTSGSDLILERCVVDGNQASQSFYAWGAGGSVRGGGIHIAGSILHLIDCQVRENVARANDYPPPNNGNGSVAYGGGLSAIAGSQLVVQRSVLSGNRIWGDTCRGANGAGLHLRDSTGQITDSQFLGNLAQATAGPNWGGGALIDGSSNLLIRDSVFQQNYASAAESMESGAAIRIVSGSVTLEGTSACGSGPTPISGVWSDGGQVSSSPFCEGLDDVVSGVSRSVPGEYTTLQAAIDASSSGDEILLAPGMYVGPFNVQSKAVRIRGTSATDTILAGQGSGPVITINGVAMPRVLLQDLTISGGRTHESGAGVRVIASLVRIVDCVLVDHIAHRDVGCAWCGSEIYGGAIYAVGGSGLTIERCLIGSNRVSQSFYAWGAGGSVRGGGIFAAGSHVRIIGSEIRENVARANDYPPPANGNGSVAFGAGIAVRLGSVLELEDSIVTGNRIFGDTCRGAYGAGIDIRESEATVASSLVEGNLAQANAGPNKGAGILVDGGSSVSVAGSRLWSNASGSATAPLPGSAATIVAGSLFLLDTDLCNNGAQPMEGAWQDDGLVTTCRDSDGDGVADLFDECPLDPWKVAAGLCGCGFSGRDLDADGFEDCCLSGPPHCCLGDLDGNGRTEAEDLFAILCAWGPTTKATRHLDLDGDDLIGGTDLALVVGSWGACP